MCRTMGIDASVSAVPAAPITQLSRRAAAASNSMCRACAMRTCPNTSGGAIRRYPAIAKAVTAIPYCRGDTKCTISKVAPAVAVLFNNHCADSQSDPRTAASVNVTASAGAGFFSNITVIRFKRCGQHWRAMSPAARRRPLSAGGPAVHRYPTSALPITHNPRRNSPDPMPVHFEPPSRSSAFYHSAALPRPRPPSPSPPSS